MVYITGNLNNRACGLVFSTEIKLVSILSDFFNVIKRMIYKIITKLHIFCLFRYGDFDMLLGDLFYIRGKKKLSRSSENAGFYVDILVRSRLAAK